MIITGNHFGGPEQKGSIIAKMLNKVMNAADDASDPNCDDGTEAWINPIFLVHGSLLQPDFEGCELGHFSAKKKGLVVKIAVPQSVANGEGIIEFIGTSLREAVRLASIHFASKGISFSTLKAEKIILAIEVELSKIAV